MPYLLKERSSLSILMSFIVLTLGLLSMQKILSVYILTYFTHCLGNSVSTTDLSLEVHNWSSNSLLVQSLLWELNECVKVPRMNFSIYHMDKMTFGLEFSHTPLWQLTTICGFKNNSKSSPALPTPVGTLFLYFLFRAYFGVFRANNLWISFHFPLLWYQYW